MTDSIGQTGNAQNEQGQGISLVGQVLFEKREVWWVMKTEVFRCGCFLICSTAFFFVVKNFVASCGLFVLYLLCRNLVTCTESDAT